MESYNKRMEDLGAVKYCHKGIVFHKTIKNIWVFAGIPPRHPYTWSAYSEQNDERGEIGMIKAIERCLSKSK